MTEPLALVAFERSIPGSQLQVKLADLGYRTEQVADLGQLIAAAETSKPLLVLVDLDWRARDPMVTINSLRNNAATEHLPIIAYGDVSDEDRLELALDNGATLVTGDDGMLLQLSRLLDQAMEID